jgi:hypothetical protein
VGYAARLGCERVVGCVCGGLLGTTYIDLVSLFYDGVVGVYRNITRYKGQRCIAATLDRGCIGVVLERQFKAVTVFGNMWDLGVLVSRSGVW